jgi:hypothetical protein
MIFELGKIPRLLQLDTNGMSVALLLLLKCVYDDSSWNEEGVFLYSLSMIVWCNIFGKHHMQPS